MVYSLGYWFVVANSLILSFEHNDPMISCVQIAYIRTRHTVEENDILLARIGPR